MSSRREAAKRFNQWINSDDRDKIRNKLQNTDWTQRSGNDVDDFIINTLEPIINKFVEMKTSLSRATHIQSNKKVESLTKQNEQLIRVNKKNVALGNLQKDMDKYKKTVKEEREYLREQIDGKSRLLTQYEIKRKENKKKIEELEAQNNELQMKLEVYQQVHNEQEQQIRNYEKELYGNDFAQFQRVVDNALPPADDEQKNDNVKPSANVTNNALSENVYFDSVMRNILRMLNKKDYDGRIVIHVQPKYSYGRLQGVSVHAMDNYKEYTAGKTIFGDGNDNQKYGIKTVFPNLHNYPLATNCVLILFKDEYNQDDFLTNAEFLKDADFKNDIIPENLFRIMKKDLIVLTWNKFWEGSNAKDVLDEMIKSLEKQDYVMLAKYLSHFGNDDILYRKVFNDPMPLDDDDDVYGADMYDLVPDLVPRVTHTDPRIKMTRLKQQIRLIISQLPPLEQKRYLRQVDNSSDMVFLNKLLDKVNSLAKLRWGD